MKKIFIGAMLLAGMSAYAQETYQNAEIAIDDLNGTARYIGMGGAMEALGADISTINTNPAGIGLFRRSQVNMSMGCVSQPDAATSRGGYVDATNFSFDQIGGVWATDFGDGHFFNIGFNYHKSRNFNNILSAYGVLNGASQNKLTAMKGTLGLFDNNNDDYYSQVDYLNENVLGLYDKFDGWSYANGTGYDFQKSTTGYVGEFDINFSGNVSDCLYLGATFGTKNVKYDAYTIYDERLIDNGQSIGSVTMEDHRWIRGEGYDFKIGAIYFPIEDSPFRIGASIATPTWYSLTTYNNTFMTNNLDSQYGAYDDGKNSEEYDFKMYTPWKFGASLGHTVANQLAIGLSYEFANYKYMKSRIIESYDYLGESRTVNDNAMNQDTKLNLRGVSTLKLGLEYKPVSTVALRAGYNYISAMYNEDAYRDGSVNSPGTYYSSTTDYTNWKSTNRFTLGAGMAQGHLAFDVAYQYTATNGEFFPFMSYYAGSNEPDSWNCIADKVDVKNQRHQFVATLTYKF